PVGELQVTLEGREVRRDEADLREPLADDDRETRVVEEDARLAEVSFVAAHFAAFERHLEFAYGLAPLPPPKARVEIVDLPRLGDVDVRLLAGQVLVSLRLGAAETAPGRAAEAAVRAWLRRCALLAGGSAGEPEPWLTQALAAETLALLRPALVDLWYRDGLREPPAALADLRAGRASEREAFLFWRALRAAHPREGAALLARHVAGGSTAALKEVEWQAARAQLLVQRKPVSLGLRESGQALDELARFVFDLGQGDALLDGPALVRQRALPAVTESMRDRLAVVRREILRQNPVHANAWRTFGAWLERFEKASPEELAERWTEFLRERDAARALAAEVEAALAAPPAKAEGRR
ncbi:hypothetical protein EBR16_08160, partial [bacterium]|nr:hypothetical protein [bacterium]